MTLQIDHLILRVSDLQATIRFYGRVLGLRHEGQQGPFEVLRINEACVIDLLPVAPRDTAHLAFQVDRAGFDDVHRRLRAMDIPFGGEPFMADGRIGAQFGAGGWGDALYFRDPDQHNIEVRTHDDR